MASDSELLRIQFRTGYVLNRAGRMVRTNDPDASPAPMFVLSGCASRNVAGIAADVPEDIANKLLALAASEPPFVDQTGAPKHIERYNELLTGGSSTLKARLGVTYLLPNHMTYEHNALLVCSDSDEGRRLRTSMADQGVPAGLKSMGFVDVSELWEPWCVVLHDGEAVSVAFAARIAEGGAALGLATAPGLRGRGYGAAATAGWAQMPALESHVLFYNTEQTNSSSKRVIERLGLRFLGASFALAGTNIVRSVNSFKLLAESAAAMLYQ